MLYSNIRYCEILINTQTCDLSAFTSQQQPSVFPNIYTMLQSNQIHCFPNMICILPHLCTFVQVLFSWNTLNTASAEDILPSQSPHQIPPAENVVSLHPPHTAPSLKVCLCDLPAGLFWVVYLLVFHDSRSLESRASVLFIFVSFPPPAPKQVA